MDLQRPLQQGANAMKSCPQCGKQYPDSEGFCETDGTPLVGDFPRGRLTTPMGEEAHEEPGLECPVCGGKALPGEVRCNYCGARLRAESFEPAGSPLSTEGAGAQSLAPGGSPPGPHEFGHSPVDSQESEPPRKKRRVLA